MLHWIKWYPPFRSEKNINALLFWQRRIQTANAESRPQAKMICQNLGTRNLKCGEVQTKLVLIYRCGNGNDWSCLAGVRFVHWFAIAEREDTAHLRHVLDLKFVGSTGAKKEASSNFLLIPARNNFLVCPFDCFELSETDAVCTVVTDAAVVVFFGPQKEGVSNFHTQPAFPLVKLLARWGQELSTQAAPHRRSIKYGRRRHE